MKTASLNNELNFNEDNVVIKVLMETKVSKEIRILFKKGHEMKKHKAGFPITVAVHSGNILFGVNGKEIVLNSGDLIYLEANTPHSLFANKDSIVRLSLSKYDKVERVKNVVA